MQGVAEVIIFVDQIADAAREAYQENTDPLSKETEVQIAQMGTGLTELKKRLQALLPCLGNKIFATKRGLALNAANEHLIDYWSKMVPQQQGKLDPIHRQLIILRNKWQQAPALNPTTTSRRGKQF